LNRYTAKFLCATCGTQYPKSEKPPRECLICQDERQYVGWNGQEWTTLEKLSIHHKNQFQKIDENLHSIITSPEFAIGQRALLLTTPSGNVLWDCLPLFDQNTRTEIENLGGLDLIAISHPHYYSSMVEWSEGFGGIPIYIHDLDKKWVVNMSPNINFWKGESISPLEGVTLVNLGGHFDGGTVLYFRGRVLSGDIIAVAQDRRWTSFMYSYPNMIPLPKSKIIQITERIGKYKFDSLYSAFEGKEILRNADTAVRRSAERYIQRITG
jgi:hypothetical protein